MSELCVRCHQREGWAMHEGLCPDCRHKQETGDGREAWYADSPEFTQELNQWRKEPT